VQKNVMMGNGFSVLPAVGIDGFRSLKNEWDRLAMNNLGYFPFLCYDWHEMWLRHFQQTDLFIPVLYKDGAIAAIMPLVRRLVVKRGVKFSKLEFIGNSYSQARSVLCYSSNSVDRTEITEKLINYLLRHAQNWDYLDLYGLQIENGNFAQTLNAAVASGVRHHVEDAYANLFQDGITTLAEEFLAGRPKIIQKNVRYNQRRMQREGGLEFRLISYSPAMDAVMDEYYALYAKSWKKSEELGPDFHRDLAKYAAKSGWLRIGFLDFNGTPIACQFWLVCGDTAYILKVFYDENYKRYSPGTVLTAYMFNSCIDNDRVSCVDFLQGDEAYKRDWVDRSRPRKSIKVFNRTIKGRLMSLFYLVIRHPKAPVS
jgi:CelD/BcsL family acetyltransferase involved in cellulose biosynthesis